MNAPNSWLYEDAMDCGNAVTYARRDQNREQRMRRHAYERRGSRPSSCNGMHRRHSKRVAW